MADRKITDLTALTTPASADVLPIVDVSEAAAADKNKKVTVGELFKGIPDGTAAAPAIAFESDDGNGFFLSTTDTIGIATNGVSRATVSTTAVTSTLPISATAFSPTSATVPTNGVYLPATNSVGIATNGSVALTIDSSQRLGVGTTSPGELLDVRAGSNPGSIAIGRTAAEGRFFVANAAGNYFNSSIAGDVGIGALGTSRLALGTFDAYPIILYTGLTERARIDSSGRLGIGTSAPQQALSISGAVQRNAVTLGTSGSPSEETGYIYKYEGASGTQAGIYFLNSHNSNNATWLSVKTTSSANVTSTALTIDSSQRVGIGTTSPGTALDVAEGARAKYIQILNNGYAGTFATTPELFSPASATLAIGAGGSERLRIDSSGRLLVGTSTTELIGVGSGGAQIQSIAANPLSVARFSNDNFGCVVAIGKSRGASAGSYTVVQNNDLLGEIRFAGADGTDLQTIGAQISAEVDGTPGSNDLPSRLVFSVTADGASSPTERMRITNDGEVFINRTSTDAEVNSACKLQVQGTASQWTAHFRNTNAAPYGVRIKYNTDANNTGNEFLVCNGNTTDRFVLRSNGGLANYQANNVNLSDINTKKDISPADGTWDCIKEWEIVNYRYKDQPDDAELNLGVIAQQVAESCPEVITVFQEAKEATDDQPAQEKRLGIKEQQMYWMAIKALQEAQVRIEQLEAKVAALESA